MTKTILKNKDIEIRVDPRNFILKRGDDYTYYLDLGFLLEVLFEDGVKSKLSTSEKSDLQDIVKTIENCRDEVKSITKELEKTYSEAFMD